MSNEIRRPQLQDHFTFGKLRSLWHAPLRAKDLDSTFRVQGKKATSNEFYVAEALEDLGFEYTFQMSVAGGRSMAFGIVLDFLVMTVPMPTPVWVHGEHWHMGDRRAKDIRQQDIVEQYMKGQVNPPLEIWGSESKNKIDATMAVRRGLR